MYRPNLILKIVLTGIGLYMIFSCKSIPMTKATKTPQELTRLWQKLDSLEQAGLPKSALSVAEEIGRISREQSLVDHQIKASLYENRFRAELEEDGMERAIERLTQQAEDSEGVGQAILFSYVGELYQNYLRDHRWELQDKLPQLTRPDDIKLMSTKDLQELSDYYYLRSLDHSTLTSVSLDSFQLLVEMNAGKMDITNEYSLFELLLSRSLEHFMSGDLGGPEAMHTFRLDNPELFTSDFVNMILEFADSSDHRLQSMKLFQRGMKAEGKEKVDLSLQRLSYLRLESEISNKDTLYVEALNRLISSGLSRSEMAKVRYSLASYYHGKGDLVKAHELCTENLEGLEDSTSGSRFRNLKKQIEEGSLRTELEQVSIPGQGILGNIRYKNVEHVFSKLLKLTFEELRSLNTMDQDQRLTMLLGRTPLEEFTTELNNPGDFLEHGTEIVITPKPVGCYVWILSNDPGFSATVGIVVVNSFQISSLSFAEESLDGQKRIRAYNRESGHSAPGVIANFYENKYSNGKVNRIFFGDAISDSDGYLRVPDDQRRGLSLVLSKDADTLALDDYHYWSYENVREDRDQLDVRFFLDRSIYRPGQLVHYKGILLARDDKQVPSVLKNRKIDVVLRDANQQEVESQSKVSNPFGSVWGTFVLPSSGRLGTMSIAVKESSSTIGFQVEEYKRPTFQIVFDTATTGKLGSEFVVRGKVRSFAGAPVGNAEYEYHVTRKSRFPGYRGWWKSPWPSLPDKEIASGILHTDDAGNFRFPFFAAGEQQGALNLHIAYDFLITIQLSDAGGETQLSNTVVTLAPRNHGVEMVSEDIINIATSKSLVFLAKSTAGNPVSVDAAMSVFRMESEPQWKRHRYWQYPDQEVLPQSDFASDLQWYSSADVNLDSQESVLVGETVLRNRGTNMIADLSALDIDPGTYKVVLKSTLDDEVQESSFYVRLVDADLPFVPTDKLMHVLQSPEPTIVGGNVRLYAGTATIGKVSYQIERNRIVTERIELKDDRGWHEITIPIEEADRGGIFVHFHCAFQNRTMEKQIKIDVPWSNKELDIHFETIRTVVKPGAEEHVEVKISGAESPLGSAEVLVSMYDASLDLLYPHRWNTDFFPVRSPRFFQNSPGYGIGYGNIYRQYDPISTDAGTWFPKLRWFGLASRGRRMYKSASPAMARSEMAEGLEEVVSTEMASSADAGSGETEQTIDVRKEFGENLVYYPDLHIDSKGELKFKYNVNDALTTWKMMLFAHDDMLVSGYRAKEIVSRKELMITVNKPRFLRAGDEVLLRGKIDNLTDETIRGAARLSLVNAMDSSPLAFAAGFEEVSFAVPAHSSTFADWKVIIPKDYAMPIQFTMMAVGENHSDGEQGVLPVLENRALVTSTRAIELGSGAELALDMREVAHQGSESAQPQSLTLEITSNPVWYAVTSLPYLMDAPYPNSEQIFNQFYANAMGLKMVKDFPIIKQVVEQWGKDAPESPLLSKQELKNSLIEESPWLLDAMSETDQMRRIATYFQGNKMDYDQRRSLSKLQEMQSGDGGFSWFSGGRSNWYMSQYILEGLIKMKGWINDDLTDDVDQIIDRGVGFMERELQSYHREVVKQPIEKPTAGDHLTPNITYYLYIKALLGTETSDQSLRALEDFYLSELKMGWMTRSLYEQAMTAQIFRITRLDSAFSTVISSLRERVLRNPQLGAYWKYDNGFTWWKLPIETHARMIEVFSGIPDDEQLVRELKRWLLNHKRTNRWSNSKATAEAVRALTMGQPSWIKAGTEVRVLSDGKPIQFSSETRWGNMQKTLVLRGSELEEVGQVDIQNPNPYPAWGAIYYQFFEDLDNITGDASGPLKINRTLFLTKNSERGTVLAPVPSSGLKVGDRVLVELKISADRDMEFIHIKDLRGAALEPIKVISNYVWKGSLGYFESNTDLATNFFVDYLPRGTYTIQYELLVNQNGHFSGGNCMIQSMYAPEFSAHSKGERIQVSK